jgi:hypothetical protein
MMNLLGNYFSALSSNIEPLLEEINGEMDSEASPTYQLAKFRRKTFGKVMRLVSSVESHIMWQHWEPTIGGSFPTETYEDIFACNLRITGYLMLMSYALTYDPLMGREDKTHKNDGKFEQEGGTSGGWRVLRDHHQRMRPNAKALQRLELTNHTVLSTLTMLSNTMLSGQRLPPFLPLPRHDEMTGSLAQLWNMDTMGESNEQEDSPLRHSYSGKDGDFSLRLMDLRQRRPDHAAKKFTGRGYGFRGGEIDKGRPGETKTEGRLTMDDRVYFLTQVCGMMVCHELESLARAVSRLVGVVDFNLYTDGSKRIDSMEGHALERPLSQDSASASVGKGKSIIGSEPSRS